MSAWECQHQRWLACRAVDANSRRYRLVAAPALPLQPYFPPDAAVLLERMAPKAVRCPQLPPPPADDAGQPGRRRSEAGEAGSITAAAAATGQLSAADEALQAGRAAAAIAAAAAAAALLPLRRPSSGAAESNSREVLTAAEPGSPPAGAQGAASLPSGLTNGSQAPTLSPGPAAGVPAQLPGPPPPWVDPAGPGPSPGQHVQHRGRAAVLPLAQAGVLSMPTAIVFARPADPAAHLQFWSPP
jgi:hypothetical protein